MNLKIKKTRQILNLILILFSIDYSVAQNISEDTLMITGQEIQIKAQKDMVRPVMRLNEVQGAFLISGKKNEVIDLTTIHANIAEKTGRQLFAKVPGVFVYDMDGSGNQMNISTRGLDPHRSWEYNIRHNGIITNTDIYGYPASHFNPPMESIKNIELIRGTAALQYGAQFGGMINYVTKGASKTKAFDFESINSIGSFGLLSTYNSIGGTIGKLSYFSYYHRRVSDGYRENAGSDANSQFINIKYSFNKDISVSASLARSIYQYQLPGPLTDKMFKENPRQSTRSRNHYSPEIYVPSFELEWNINQNTFLELKSSAIYGNRNSVLFIGFANTPDTINTQTGRFNSRQVDIDNYNSKYTEFRLRHNYNIGSIKNIIAFGACHIYNDTRRRQLGKGSEGVDYDLTIDGNFRRDLHFRTENIAFYAEQLTYITSKWTVTPGVRYETGNTNMMGTVFNIPESINQNIKRNFLMVGFSSQYNLDKKHKVYAGYSQAYRPVIFADLIPIDALQRTDPNLKDASGFNADFGVSGAFKNRIFYDVSFFVLKYNNRIGNQLLTENNTSFLYRTNTGNTLTTGLEAYIEGILFRSEQSKISLFTSTSYFNGEYRKGNIVFSNQNIDISGNRQESLPQLISRNGISGQHKKISGTLQFSYVSDSFADPANTVTPSENGAVGVVPAYGLWDLHISFIANDYLTIKCGINNITDNQYFTKRPTTYPGGGIWPSDGRSFILTAGIKL